jgi:hypothetical protein
LRAEEPKPSINNPAPVAFDSPEARLLFASVAAARDGKTFEAILDSLRAPIRWDAFLQVAGRHRVRPLVHAALRQAPASLVPANINAHLSNFVHANAHRNLYLISELRRLLDSFAGAGITVVPFKGPVLAVELYRNPSLREAGDLDLLVHRADIVRARNLLISLGHQPIFPTATPAESAYLAKLTGKRESAYVQAHSEHHLVREQGQLNIDLHWALAVSDFYLPLDEQRLWSWIAPRPFIGRDVQTFSPEALLIVLCINGGKDCWERLDRICDVAALLARHPSLDWEYIITQAAAIGVQRIVGLGLRLAADLLAAPLPAQARRFIEPDTAIASLETEVRQHLFVVESSTAETASLRRSLLHLRLRERISDRVGYCLAHLKPGVGDWAAFPLPPALHFLYYLTRPLRLAGRYLLTALRQS